MPEPWELFPLPPEQRDKIVQHIERKGTELRRELDDSKVVIAALLAKHCNGRAVLTDEDLTTVERGRLSVRSDPLHGTLLLTYEPGS